MIDYKDFGQRVRDLRRKQDLTQEELAEKIDLSASFLGHIERGSRIASLETLVALCNALQTSPHYLLAASLDDELTAHMPASMTPEERSKLGTFFRLAQETIDSWND